MEFQPLNSQLMKLLNSYDYFFLIEEQNCACEYGNRSLLTFFHPN